MKLPETVIARQKAAVAASDALRRFADACNIEGRYVDEREARDIAKYIDRFRESLQDTPET